MRGHVVFQGEYKNSIDAKGRLSIPARFRDVLAQRYEDERLIVTRRGEALCAYPVPVWDNVVTQVMDMPASADKDHILRTRVAPATECQFDRHGRIQVPHSLRTAAAFEKEVVVVGMLEKMELWSAERHAAEVERSEARLSEVQQLLADVGL